MSSHAVAMIRDLTTAAMAVAAALVSGGVVCARSVDPTEGAPQQLRIVVPGAGPCRVTTDGQFSPGEWDGAYRLRISESFEVYLLADSADLCIGFRFLEDVEADFVSEVYLAINDAEFLNLHSSGALGEGANSFSPDLRRPEFTVGRSVGWESNVTERAARSQGKEFKISRARLPDAIVRMAGGLIVVNRSIRETANFPERFGFGGPDGWVELVLPPSEPE